MPRAQARAQRRSTPSTIRRHVGLSSSSALPFYRNLATVTRMGNDGFDSSDETGYSSDDGYISCQRNGCGRSNPWGDLGCTYTHCCTLCSCWENGKWQIHSIECDADYIRECILRQPRKLGRTGRELMLLDIRDRGALSLRLCMKSEVDLLRVILFRTWVRTWRTSQLRYAQYIRNCKFKEYMRLGNSQWRQGPMNSSVCWTRRSLQDTIIWERVD